MKKFTFFVVIIVAISFFFDINLFTTKRLKTSHPFKNILLEGCIFVPVFLFGTGSLLRTYAIFSLWKNLRSWRLLVRPLPEKLL